MQKYIEPPIPKGNVAKFKAVYLPPYEVSAMKAKRSRPNGCTYDIDLARKILANKFYWADIFQKLLESQKKTQYTRTETDEEVRFNYKDSII
jgi:hypothetical protein